MHVQVFFYILFTVEKSWNELKFQNKEAVEKLETSVWWGIIIIHWGIKWWLRGNFQWDEKEENPRT